MKLLSRRIELLPAGEVFVVADFLDIAEPKTISKILTRLSEDGKVAKVMRSVFWKPDGLNDSPHPEKVAEALARENDWVVAPTGETAQHLLGVSEKRPDEWTYVTTGTAGEYQYGKFRITFKHTNNSYFARMSRKTKMLVQSIKAFGKETFSGENAEKIKNVTKGWNLKKLLDETRQAPQWIKDKIKDITEARSAKDKGE